MSINFSSVGVGAAGGVAWAISNWQKNVSSDGGFEKFDLKLALPTVILGAVVGGVSAAFGMPLDQGYNWLYSTGMVPIVHNLLKGIFRHWGMGSGGLVGDLKNPDAPK